MKNQHHWEYYLAIEDDLIRTSRFVEFTTDNYSTYSIEFTKIILASSSEFDVIAKMLCTEISSTAAANNINDYRSVILSAFPKFPIMELNLSRHHINLKPWTDWQTKPTPQNPFWWTNYNNVKHQRNKCYEKANLETSLNSVAGLLCGLLHLFRKTEGKNIRLIPGTQLFESKNNTMFIDGIFGWRFSLPDDTP